MTLCITFYFTFNSSLIDIVTNYFAKNQNILSHFSRLETRAMNSSSPGVVDLMCPTGKSVVMKFPTIENVVKGVVISTKLFPDFNEDSSILLNVVIPCLSQKSLMSAFSDTTAT
mmetsp:Transcript_19983/g.49722  ORF Transcript_19983/g.49722 Transcript_19983/m.49722 type:complete len:114 (-) Transcript_19983:1960-2301(-)